jgi:hypothetical protein
MYDDRTNDMETLFTMKLDAKVATDRWPFVPQEFRRYEVIEEYVPNPGEFAD